MKCCCKAPTEEKIIQNTSVLICKRCGLIQKKDFLSFQEEKKRYDLHICDDGYKVYMQKVVEKISNEIKPGRILDFGCGKIHLLADLLNEQNRECLYYDLIYYPTLPTGTFDTIILIEVFEHFKQPYEELKKLESMLKPHGKILIMTKPYDGVDLEKWWYFRDSTHISFIEKKTLEFWNLPFQIVQKNGDIFILERIY